MNENNEDKVIKKLMKKDFNKLGLALVMNELVLNVVVFIIIIGTMIIQMINNPNMGEDQFMQILDNASFNGIMSIIASFIAFIPILIYRRKKFLQYDLVVENKKFTIKIVIIGFIILFSMNATLGVFVEGLEFLLNGVGLTARGALEDLEILNQPSIVMVLSTCIVGPIFEEFVYRGVVLRTLEKYGRWFAILVSSILFGLMHGNFYQIFMAVGIGIILGYLTTEYSIKIAIILHICNNTMVQLLSEINARVSGNIVDVINISLTAASIIIVIITFVRNKSYIKSWLESNRFEKKITLRFFTSITIIIIVAFNLYMVITGITKI
ncbi:hypothetical protein SH2C18_29270 [Clostridium sediminicola]|uniref:CPBP family intramembrane glutamic endopeptidase n=1 Tax=Clostridium sediminicola TaxID=3114879 RepID=UPI0031F1D65E